MEISHASHITGLERSVRTNTDERARLDLNEQDDNDDDELDCESRFISTWKIKALARLFSEPTRCGPDHVEHSRSEIDTRDIGTDMVDQLSVGMLDSRSVGQVDRT